jgi:tetratricopeptide (TPR) repeat protein
LLGKYDKVEEFYKRAIDIYATHYGPYDTNVLKSKTNLAAAYMREGKYKLASQLYQDVLVQAQHIFNEQSSSAQKVLVDSGNINAASQYVPIAFRAATTLLF